MRHTFAENYHIARTGKNRHDHWIVLFSCAEGISEIRLMATGYSCKGAIFDLCHIGKNNYAFCAGTIETTIRVIVGVINVPVRRESASVEATQNTRRGPNLLDVIGCRNEDRAPSES